VSMKPQSAKAKGRGLQQMVARDLVALFPNVLEADDCRSTSMGAAGDDVLFSPLAARIFRVSIECKKVEKLSIWAAIRQGRERRSDDGKIPIVVASHNYREPVAVVPFGWLYNAVAGRKILHDEMSADQGTLFDTCLKTLPGFVHEGDKTMLSWCEWPVGCVDARNMPFWPTVDLTAKNTIIVFNSGNRGLPVHAVVPWPLFLHVLHKHGSSIAAVSAPKNVAVEEEATGAFDTTGVVWPPLP
jgi:hypothetical protein